MDYILPFTTYFNSTPDLNNSDSLKETELLLKRQTAIDKMLRTGEGFNDVCDLLNDQGYDVDSYIDSCVDSVEYVISHSVPIDEPIIFIP